MKLFYSLTSIILLSVFLSCSSENRDNSRAYVEGRIEAKQADLNLITVIIKSENKNMAETIPDGSGEFVLSGPLLSDSFSLVINRKIKSFSASKEGCSLSDNAKEIMIPSGTTYITFNEIILE